MTTPPRELDSSALEAELEACIAAPFAAVWATLVGRPDVWWPRELRCVPGASRMRLEPCAGGHLVEENDAGESLLWFTVLHVQPGEALNLAGALAPPFGGPATTFLRLHLVDEGASTRVRLTYSMHGHVPASAWSELEAGWRLLLEQGLRPAVEGA